MNAKVNEDLTILVNYACDSRKCQHLYLRGNFKQEMFYDKVDKINVWNRMWLSAAATGVKILSLKILNNHFHLTALLQDDNQRTRFKTHFRLSVTQYHNRRYDVRGTLGTRTLKHGILKDIDDVKDCICYHIRNILHHGLQSNFLDYQFSTARYVFGLAGPEQQGTYSRETLPDNLAKAYLPSRQKLPMDWMMTREGMIVPPAEVFRSDIVEALFDSRESYLESLSHRTGREDGDNDEPQKLTPYASHSRKVLSRDEEVVQFVKENCVVPIPSMTPGQKMEAIRKIVEEFPKVSLRVLTRLFSIPYSTLRYRMKSWHIRE